MSRSEYAIRMSRLSKQIFGEIVTPTDQKSMKVVKIHKKLPAHKNPDLVKYYPNPRPIANLMKKLREEGLYRDEHADMVDLFEQRRKERGVVRKVPLSIQKRLEMEAKAKEEGGKAVTEDDS